MYTWRPWTLFHRKWHRGRQKETCSASDSKRCLDVQINTQTYDSVVYELKSDQPGVKVSKDGNEEWIPVVKKRRKRTCKRKDESEPVSVSDDSGDELKVKFAREVRYKVQDGTPGLKIRRGNTMRSWKWTPIAPSPIANRTRSRIS